LRNAVKRQTEKQGCYRRSHEVIKLEQFGIDENRLKDDFSFIFDKNRFSGQDAFLPFENNKMRTRCA